MEKTLHHFYELKNKRVHAELFTCNLPDPLYLILNRPRRTLERQRPGQHQTTYRNIECVGLEGRYRRQFHSKSVSTTSTNVLMERNMTPDPHPSKWCKVFSTTGPRSVVSRIPRNDAGVGREQTNKCVQRFSTAGPRFVVSRIP